MKKFDGLNLKKKKEAREKKEDSSFLILPTFIEPEQVPIRKAPVKNTHLNIGNSHFITIKNIAKLVVWIIVFTTLIFLGNQAIKTQKSLLSLQDSMEKNLGLIEVYAGNGNVEGSLDQLDKLQTNVVKSKLIAEAWGQDVDFFQYIPGHKSSLTQKEILLGTGYDLINFSEELKKDASSIQENSISVSNTKTYNIDLTLIGQRIGKIVKKVNKKVSLYRHLLSGTDSVQAEKITSNLDHLSAETSGINNFLKKDLPWLSGSDGKEKNIMLIFQNNGELRGGSGGSLGSFGILKFKNGELNDVSFAKNIYKIDKAYKAQNHVDPPEIINFLTPDWVLKDAGWSEDGPTAFSTIEEFYTKETGDDVDGVIVLDATFFEKLLEKIGPIDLPQYGKTIDNKNFRAEIEAEVHDTYFDNPANLVENEPKKILGEMIPLVMDKIVKSLSDQNKLTGILGAVNDGLSQKHILFYANDKNLQNMIEQNNWSGKVGLPMGDYLYVNNSNIAGGKSSVNINETINLDATIGDDGKVANKLTVDRDYAVNNNDKDNINFVRLGLLQDATVIQFNPLAGNFEQMLDKGYKNNQPYWQTTEFSKSWLNYWMSTGVNQKSKLLINYNSGYKVTLGDSFVYQTMIQKQPGSMDDSVTFKIHYPSGYKPVNIKNYDAKNHSAEIKLNLKSDVNVKIKFIKE